VKKIINYKTVLIIILILVLFYKLASMMGGGSYAYSEYYEICVPEQKAIKIIEQFKSENPQYNAPASMNIFEGRKDSSDYSTPHL
jgi:hypothetical protein